MSIEITDIADLREGDYATFSYDGHEFSGKLYRDSWGDLMIGSTDVIDGDGDLEYGLDFISASRGPRELPTKLSVIRARDIHRYGNVHVELFLHGPDEDGDFIPLTGQGVEGYFNETHLQNFDILWTLDEEAA